MCVACLPHSQSCLLLQSVATRGWELPNLQEVQAKSDALAASGFATVHSPVISKASQHALAKQASQCILQWSTDYYNV